MPVEGDFFRFFYKLRRIYSLQNYKSTSRELA